MTIESPPVQPSKKRLLLALYIDLWFYGAAFGALYYFAIGSHPNLVLLAFRKRFRRQ